jgi:hypothetical protein
MITIVVQIKGNNFKDKVNYWFALRFKLLIHKRNLILFTLGN